LNLGCESVKVGVHKLFTLALSKKPLLALSHKLASFYMLMQSIFLCRRLLVSGTK